MAESGKKKQTTTTRSPEPPSPPQLGRQLRLTPAQWGFSALVVALPLASLLGLLGPRHHGAESGEVRIHHPEIVRLGSSDRMIVSVAGVDPDSIEVEIDSTYARHFGPIQERTGTGGGLELQLEPSRRGTARGTARVRAGELRRDITLQTRVLP